MATSPAGAPTPIPSGPTPPSASTGTTAPASPSAARGLSGGAKAGIAVAVVVLLVLAVWALGLIPGVASPFKASSSGGGDSSSSAVGHAAGLAASSGAGKLLFEIGISMPFSFSFGYVKGNSSCPITGGFASTSDNFTVPAESSNYSSGLASLWLLMYYNSSVPSESVLAVVGSTPYFLGKLSGASCLTDTDLPTIPSGTIDSTAAASALAPFASPFTSAHASATAVYLLVDEKTSGPEWVVIFTNCSYDPDTNTTIGGKMADAFLGGVNASTGSLFPTETTSSLNCSGLNISGGSLVVAPDPATAAVSGTAAGLPSAAPTVPARLPGSSRTAATAR